MDIKWKNTDDKSKWEALKERNQDVVTLIGGAFLIIGLFSVAVLLIFRDELGDGSGIVMGVLGNLSLAAGSVMIVDMVMKNRYGNWMPEGGDRYSAWKETVRKMNRRDRKIGAAALIIAVLYLIIIVQGYSYYYSAVSGYMMTITVLVQFLIYEWRIRRFWQAKLDEVTEKEEEEKEALIRLRIEEVREIERKSLEKVSRSDQLRIDLITNVSHDLKTPLTSMVGYIELMKKEELSDVMQDYVEVLSERAGKLGEMVNSLFSLAKASSGNVELKMEHFEINRLIDQIFADMDDKMKESGLEFIIQKTEESTELVSDNMYCYRICQNLLENALKYSAKGTRIFVKTYVKNADRNSRRICLEIINTAGYFMDFTKEDIVERFARGDKARSSEGNGLGLAIVSTYTKALGGEFDIRIDCDQFRAVVELPAENTAIGCSEAAAVHSKTDISEEGEKERKAL